MVCLYVHERCRNDKKMITNRLFSAKVFKLNTYETNICLKVNHFRSQSDFHFKSTSLIKSTPPPLESHHLWAPPLRIHLTNVLLSAALRNMHLTSTTSLRGYNSPVDKLYLRVMFQQEFAKDCVCAATPFHWTILTTLSSSMLERRTLSAWTSEEGKVSIWETSYHVLSTSKAILLLLFERLQLHSVIQTTRSSVDKVCFWHNTSPLLTLVAALNGVNSFRWVSITIE